jgi:hypothetical protein
MLFDTGYWPVYDLALALELYLLNLLIDGLIYVLILRLHYQKYHFETKDFFLINIHVIVGFCADASLRLWCDPSTSWNQLLSCMANPLAGVILSILLFIFHFIVFELTQKTISLKFKIVGSLIFCLWTNPVNVFIVLYFVQGGYWNPWILFPVVEIFIAIFVVVIIKYILFENKKKIPEWGRSDGC